MKRERDPTEPGSFLPPLKPMATHYDEESPNVPPAEDFTSPLNIPRRSSSLRSTSETRFQPAPPGEDVLPEEGSRSNIVRPNSIRLSRAASTTHEVIYPHETRSNIPSSSEPQRMSLGETATRQQKLDEIQRTNSRINAISSSPTQESRVRQVENELAMLREYVNELESRLYRTQPAEPGYDDPPPSYRERRHLSNK